MSMPEAVARCVLACREGLRTVGGESVPTPFGGRVVTTGAVANGRAAVVVDEREVWELSAGRWRHRCTLAARLNCLWYGPDSRLWAGVEGARLATVAGRAAHFSASFDTLAGTAGWGTPWHGPANVHGLTATADGALLAGIHMGGVVRSPDNGRSWEPVGSTVDRDVCGLAVDPRRGNVLVATGDGLFASDDGGGTFTRRWTGSGPSYLRAVAVVPDTGVWIASAHPDASRTATTAILRSADQGRSWHPGAGVPAVGLGHVNTLRAVGPSTVVGLAYDRALWTTDGGLTWSSSGPLPPRQFDPKRHFVTPLLVDPAAAGVAPAQTVRGARR